MTSNRKLAVSVVAVVALLFVGLLALFGGTAQAANPGPLAIPTPVTNNPAAVVARPVEFLVTRVITQDTASDALNIQNYGKADVQWVFDQTLVAAAANTTTLKLQFSNNGLNWVDGATLVSANAADATDMNQFAVFGRYARVYVDVTNSLPVTVTAIGLGK
jgi:hypothetical protein